MLAVCTPSSSLFVVCVVAGMLAVTIAGVQDSKIKFPLPHRLIQRTPSTFVARRPNTTY